MKYTMTLLALAATLSAQAMTESDSVNHADHLDLHAVLSLFKEAENLEDFEKLLNSEEKGVNNLDLNGDDEVDYIRVIDHVEGDVHALTLRVPLDEDEEQDVAVIELEKTGDEEAQVQIVGDEDIYGTAYYIEPKSNASTEYLRAPAVFVNVWFWPSVRFVYAPGYRPYVSPFRWRKYPRWWKPRRPVAVAVYRPRVAPYRAHFHAVKVHRTVKAHRIYTRNRVVSRRVYRRATVKQQQRANRQRNAPTNRPRGRRR